jgi:tetratricopeptide (TPR) repeat protein
MSGQRGILILDNVSDGEQVRPVLPLPIGWVILITSRRRFALRNAMLVDLHVLAPHEAEALLVRQLAQGGRTDLSNGDNQASLRNLIELCGYLPLALRIVTGFLCNAPNWTLDAYSNALEREKHKYLTIEGERGLDVVLGLSVTQLRNENPELAKLWFKLAVFSAPFDKALASGLWGILSAFAKQVSSKPDMFTGEFKVIPMPEDDTQDALTSLVQWNILSYNSPTDTYALHNLLRDYAYQAEDYEGELGESLDSIYSRHSFDCLTRGGKLRREWTEGKRIRLEVLSEFDIVWPHLKAVWQYQNKQTNESALNWLAQFPTLLSDLLDIRLKASERMVYYQKGAEAAKQNNSRRWEAMNLGNLGNTYFVLQQLDVALEKHKEALEIHRSLGDQAGESLDLGNIGAIHARQDNTNDAIEYTKQAIGIARELGDTANANRWLSNLASFYDGGDAKQANELFQEILKVSREIGDAKTEAMVLMNIGNRRQQDGRYDESKKLYEQALNLSQEIGDRRFEASALLNLGRWHLLQKRFQEAANHLQAAYMIGANVEDQYISLTSLRMLGNAYFLMNDMEKAAASYEDIFAIHEQNKDCEEMVGAWEYLNTIYKELGWDNKREYYLDQMMKCCENSVAMYRRYENRHLEGASMGNLAAVFWFRNDPQNAIRHYDQALDIVREIDDSEMEAWLLLSQGTIYSKVTQFREARMSWERALMIYQKLGMNEFVSMVNKWLEVLQKDSPKD